MAQTWHAWAPNEASTLSLGHGHMGVFELADANENVLLIGYAGGSSREGLSGSIRAAWAKVPEARLVRWEVTTSYWSRYQERLMQYQATHHMLPPHNTDSPKGRLNPHHGS